MNIRQEDLIKFWTWCGFKQITHAQEYPDISTNHPESVVRWLFPNNDKDYRLPGLDLNNLYEFAIPELQKEGYSVDLTASEECFTANIWTKDGGLSNEVSTSPTEALFNAIMKVIEKDV